MFVARAKIALFACALALVFFFGSLASGLAHESAPGQSAYGVKIDLDSSRKIAHAGAPTWRIGVDWETCDVSTPSAKTPETARFFATPPRRHVKVFASGALYTAKVSRHMLDSILLI